MSDHTNHLRLVSSHEVDQLATRRGDAPKLDREMGWRSVGERFRSFSRPPRTAEAQHATGAPSKLAQAETELLARDRVNPAGADVWLANLKHRLGLQRALRAGAVGDTWADVTIYLIETFASAAIALVRMRDAREAARGMLKLGAAANRAHIWLETREERPPAGEGAMRRAA